jgi:type IV pilus assembly protein PilB
MARVRIGELMVRQGRIDEMQLQSALAHQRRWGGRIGGAIVGLGFVSEPTFLEALSEQLGTPFIVVGDRAVERSVLALVPEKLVRARRVLPLAKLNESRRGPLVVALADPGDLAVLDEVGFVTGLSVRPVLAAEADLDRAIRRLLGDHAGVTQRMLRAIELPEDTSPLAGARPTKRTLN